MIAWLLAKRLVTSVIIGAKRLDQFQDNLAAVELALTQDELGQLDEVSALAPEYPGVGAAVLRSLSRTCGGGLGVGALSAVGLAERAPTRLAEFIIGRRFAPTRWLGTLPRKRQGCPGNDSLCRSACPANPA
jgi:hypothetical protein